MRFADPQGLYANVVAAGVIRVVGGRSAGAAIGIGLRRVAGPTVGGAIACLIVFDGCSDLLNLNESSDTDNVIPFPDLTPKDDEGEFCPPGGGGDGGHQCTSTGLAGVTLSGQYGMTLQCQYQCPRKGTRILTRSIAFRSENPAFLCESTVPEYLFP